MNKVTCPICNENFDNNLLLSVHCYKKHNKSASELYDLLNPSHNKTCKNCGSLTKFIRLTKGYQSFCSKDCANVFQRNNEEFKLKKCEKKKRTSLKKYGVENFSETDEWKEKFKKTNMERYGVEHPSKNEEVKEKRKSTIIKNHPNGLVVSDETKKKIKETFIKNYGVDNPLKCKEIRDKYESTCIERYGSKVPTKSKDVMDKMKQTNMERYGVYMPTENEEIKSKIFQTNLERYGKKTYNQSDKYKTEIFKINYDKLKNRCEISNIKPLFNETEYTGVLDDNNNSKKYKFICEICKNDEIYLDVNNGKLPICRTCNPITTSIGETEILQYIKNNFADFKIESGNRNILSGQELDIYIPEKKIAIEFNGIYWHSESNGKDKSYHMDKTLECEKQGIRLIHVFENEWIDKRDIVKSKLLNILGKHKESIYARKCSIKIPTKKEKLNFLNENHIQGNDSSSIYYGLYFKDKLVSIMTFGKLRISMGNRNRNIGEYELYRFASILNHNIVGAASKLLAHFVKNNNPEKIITYADRRWSSKQNMYGKIGFSFIGETKPNYWYFHKNDCLSLLHRFNFAKYKLKGKFETFNQNLTEYENMKTNGYNRIWDCGHLKYEKIYNKK